MSLSPAYPITVDVMNSWHAAPGAIARIRAAIRAARDRRAMRRSYEALLLREDHLLHDIGVTRADVRSVLESCRS